MIQRTAKQWQEGYKVWRVRFAQLPTKVRTRLVRGCFAKTAFDTRAEAEPFCAALLPRPGLTANVYRCPLCGGWHIGNTRFGGESRAT